ncbi:MAG: dihydrodipicolinate reductase [Gemmatimonadaceae bacterium]|nr:dihydrodipicolinate reductase [Gemmatimonadaceae bacterium]
MSAKRIAIIGDGKMGQAIAALAPGSGCEVVAMIGEGESHSPEGISKTSLANADVAIEFTQPDAALGNVRACLKAGIPVVVGTTGWYDELPALTEEVSRSGGAVLWSANFSVGINVMLRLASRMGELLEGSDAFDAHIVETHHSEKKDAPSGTARVLGEALEKTLNMRVPITSIRTGSVPGTHEIVFDGRFEQIVLSHVARDRKVFAEGALTAAKWLAGKKGVFTMADVL